MNTEPVPPTKPSSRRKPMIAIVVAVIAAVATVAAAVISRIPLESNSSTPPNRLLGKSICFVENGAISLKPLRIKGQNAYQKTSQNGDFDLPFNEFECKYEIYEQETMKWLGTFICPNDLDNEVIVIIANQKSVFWTPAPQTTQVISP
jgi:hypothetical protein